MTFALDEPGEFDTRRNWPAHARLVSTRALRTAQTAIADAVERRCMTCLHGDAGVGKTLSATSTLRTTAREQMIWPRFPVPRPTPRNLRQELFRALPLRGPMPYQPSAIESLLHEALARRRYVLVFDDVQYLNTDCLHLIRRLWDVGDRRPAVVFIGDQRGYEKLRRELAARMYAWNRIDPLRADEVRTAMPAYHRAWANVPSTLIDKADAHGPHGRMRSWVQLTKKCLQGMQRFGKDRIDEPLLDWALLSTFGLPREH
ncbi:ATP-binding protein [Streptomyces sp. NBC_01410]|uniref:AAA family ATPase n=1 Tax=Streptomyces sp. NBC_01410 TaxID=2903856 RepID=UPI00324DDB99